jgi:hypothetical protein
MLKRILFILGLFLCLSPAFALAQELAHPDLSKLPKEQQIEVAKIVQEKLNATSAIPGISNPQKVGEWLGVGKQVADLIPIFAEKTGIAADKVLNSFSGKVLLTIVLVHFFWAKAMGLLIFIFAPLIWLKLFRKLYLVKTSECIVHPNPIMRAIGFTKSMTTYKNVGQAFEEASEGATVIGFLFVAAGIASLIIPICVILFG